LQNTIIDNLKGGLLIIAPVGTGKTLTLAELAAFAVSQGIDPDRILSLIFTNRAAKEMGNTAGYQIPSATEEMRRSLRQCNRSSEHDAE